ncbi:hypothetical protein LMG29542_08154 [Paraburkholderia humisilvae]|uniref:Uncharacterized protein n=1 Tax=Paraburkholderia humisilvae TaxID=627669 RepID=A0A6J5FAQ7_9BURK|nr:hypothetical protein LMG29542_08154 [Paraburkholderia humisilvae]
MPALPLRHVAARTSTLHQPFDPNGGEAGYMIIRTPGNPSPWRPIGEAQICYDLSEH